MELGIFPKDFRKNPYVKFSENPSIGMRVVAHEWVEEEAHMAKLTVAFRSFACATNYEVIECRELGEWKM
jgi:hypothetical protein